MPEPQDFNATAEMMEQMRELRRDVSEIRTAQASQPTRADLQAYVLKEVFELEVKNLKKTDQDQEDRLESLDDRVQSQAQKVLQNVGIAVAVASGVFSILHAFAH